MLTKTVVSVIFCYSDCENNILLVINLIDVNLVPSFVLSKFKKSNFKLKGAIKHCDRLANYNPHAGVFFVVIPLKFKSLYFTLPTFVCGSLLMLKNVMPYYSSDV